MSSGRTGAYSRTPLVSRTFFRAVLIVGAVCAFLGISAFVAGTVSAQQTTTMEASWYGPGFEGLSTASGEPFNPQDYTAAHKTLAFGTKLIVTYQGRSVVVRINDRGPYVAGRELDLSQAAAEYVGLTAAGTGTVEVTYADASTPTGPYSGAAAPQPEPEQPEPEQPAPVQDTPQNQPAPQDDGSESAPGDQYADDVAVPDGTEDDNAADNQYEDENAANNQYTDSSAPDDQYADTAPELQAVAPTDDQYEDEQPRVAAAAPPAPEVPAPAPTVETAEAPPVELATPGSTVEKRIELAIAAPPVDYAGPLPETPISKAPVAEAAPTAPAVASDDDKELPSVASGLTVLPDTGGIPVMPLAGAAVLVSLLAGVGIFRR